MAWYCHFVALLITTPSIYQLSPGTTRFDLVLEFIFVHPSQGARKFPHPTFERFPYPRREIFSLVLSRYTLGTCSVSSVYPGLSLSKPVSLITDVFETTRSHPTLRPYRFRPSIQTSRTVAPIIYIRPIRPPCRCRPASFFLSHRQIVEARYLQAKPNLTSSISSFSPWLEIHLAIMRMS
ncbi:unnamed protein product [Somion occarium]|uniref:Secreted protein n=1 Tax=Somion occarium TaxID=3059160 RepID=A0ABP1DM02_9APHY